MFKRVISETGQELWYKDGKLTAKKYVPVEDVERYEKPKEEPPVIVFTKTEVKPSEPKLSRGCIICGGPEEHQRTVHIKDEIRDVKMCGVCYQSITLGQVVERVNKLKEKGMI